jgi:hypothetical protein
LKTRTKFLTGRPSAALGAVLASAAMIVSMGVSAPSGASTVKAASPSAFCTTVISFRPKAAPAATSLASYKAWAKTLVPFYEKLASEAPTAASKTVLNGVVVVLKDYTSSASLAKLEGYVAANHAKWTAGTKALAAAIISCAKSFE